MATALFAHRLLVTKVGANTMNSASAKAAISLRREFSQKRRLIMPNMDDYHAFTSTQGGSGGASGGGSNNIGCLAWTVIIIVVVLLIYFIASGADWDAIDSLSGLGLIAVLIAKYLFK